MKVNNMLSAYKKLTDFNKTYKNTKRIYQDMQEVYFKHKFKDGVFCPSSEIYTIAPIFLMERERRGMGNGFGCQKQKRFIDNLNIES